MTESERSIVVRWLIENVYASHVPSDEGNDDALLFNLVSLAIDGDGCQQYEYHEIQDRQVEEWRSGRIPTAIEPLPPPPPPAKVDRIGSFAFLSHSGTVLAAGKIMRCGGNFSAGAVVTTTGTATHCVAEIGGRPLEVHMTPAGWLCVHGGIATIDLRTIPAELAMDAPAVPDDAPLISEKPISIAGLIGPHGSSSAWRDLPPML